jgi:hypothetical protein
VKAGAWKSVADAISEKRDEEGRLVIDHKAEACLHCGAPVEMVVAGNNRLVWYHTPINCCQKQRDAFRVREDEAEDSQPMPVPYKDA